MTRTSRSVSIIALGSLLLLTSASAVIAKGCWHESYLRAVQLIDSGQLAEAAPLLHRVIDEQPFPDARVWIPGDRALLYLPYYQRARILVAQGDFERAQFDAELSLAFGEVRRSPRQARHLDLMRRDLLAAQPRQGITLVSRNSGR